MNTCTYCNKEYNAKVKRQKYCSDSCRVRAWNERLTNKINSIEMQETNVPITSIETQATTKLDSMIERILNERQAVYESKMIAMQKEYENKILELRLTDLERKVKDLEKAQEDSTGQIKLQDVMAGVGSYFATQMSNQTTKTDAKG